MVKKSIVVRLVKGEIMNLDDYEYPWQKKVLFYLSRMEVDRPNVFISEDDIALETNYSRAIVSQALKIFEQDGVVEKDFERQYPGEWTWRVKPQGDDKKDDD